MNEVTIWSQDGPKEEIEIRCTKAVEQFWEKGMKQLGIEVRALHQNKDFPFALAAIYVDPRLTRVIARKLVGEAFPRLRHCSMFFYKKAFLKNVKELLDREEVGKELQHNLEWTKQKVREKLPAAIKEKVEKGKELIVLLDTWIFCYARDDKTIYVLDVYDSQHEATLLMKFLEEKANKFGKLLGFKLEKWTDIELISVDDEKGVVYATVRINPSGQMKEKR